MFFVTQIYETILMIQGTISQTIFHCNSNLVKFDSALIQVVVNDRYEIVYMVRQLACRGIRKM